MSKKIILWAIKCQRGIDPSTVGYYRATAINKFLGDHPLIRDWKQAYSDGFRVVKLQEVGK